MEKDKGEGDAGELWLKSVTNREDKTDKNRASYHGSCANHQRAKRQVSHQQCALEISMKSAQVMLAFINHPEPEC